RRQLAQQAEPLCSHFHGQGGDSGGVAAGPVEARYESQFNRWVCDEKVNRNGRGRGFGRDRCRGRGQRGDYGNALTDQIRRQFPQSVVFSLGPAEFDGDVLSLHKAGRPSLCEIRPGVWRLPRANQSEGIPSPAWPIAARAQQAGTPTPRCQAASGIRGVSCYGLFPALGLQSRLLPFLLSLDLVEFGQRAFEFVVEQPHRIENFAEG